MKNAIFELVVFDMDGVVIDTRKPIEEFWFKLGNNYQVEITPELMDKKIHGCPARQTVNALFIHLSNQQKEEILEQCEVFEESLHFIAMPGIIELLRNLQASSIPTALVTSSLPNKVARVFEQLELHKLFNTIVTADLVEKGKPDPACYLLAAKRLCKVPENCIVFEDAVSGVKAAVAAGMFTIGIGSLIQAPWLKEVGAKEVILDFKEAKVEKLGKDDLQLILKPDFSLEILASQFIIYS